MGAGKKSPVGVPDAAGLFPGHGMAADEIHPGGKTFGGLQYAPLHAAYVGDQRAGAEAGRMLFQKSYDALGMQAQDHHVRLFHHAGVRGDAVGHTVGPRKRKRFLAGVHADDLIIPEAL